MHLTVGCMKLTQSARGTLSAGGAPEHRKLPKSGNFVNGGVCAASGSRCADGAILTQVRASVRRIWSDYGKFSWRVARGALSICGWSPWLEAAASLARGRLSCVATSVMRCPDGYALRCEKRSFSSLHLAAVSYSRCVRTAVSTAHNRRRCARPFALRTSDGCERGRKRAVRPESEQCGEKGGERPPGSSVTELNQCAQLVHADAANLAAAYLERYHDVDPVSVALLVVSCVVHERL